MLVGLVEAHAALDVKDQGINSRRGEYRHLVLKGGRELTDREKM